MRKITLKRYYMFFAAAIFLILISGCSNKNIDANWGESTGDVITKLNNAGVKYYLNEDDRKATIIIEYDDFDSESYFDERVYYFSKKMVADGSETDYPQGVLVLIGNEVTDKNIDYIKAQKEIDNAIKEYGKPSEAPQEENLGGYIWDKDDTIVSTSYYEEEGKFRLTKRMKNSSRGDIGKEEKKRAVKGEKLDFELGEKETNFIKRIQKENFTYYLVSKLKSDVIYITTDGKSINESGMYVTYYFAFDDEGRERLLSVIGEAERMSSEKAGSVIEEMKKKYGEPQSKPQEEGEFSGYVWEREGESVETLFENGVLYVTREKTEKKS